MRRHSCSSHRSYLQKSVPFAALTLQPRTHLRRALAVIPHMLMQKTKHQRSSDAQQRARVSRANAGRTAIERPPPQERRRPSTSLLLGGGLLGGGLLGSGGLGGGFLRGFLLDCHRYHLVVQRHTCLSPTGMNRPVPAPIDTKSFSDWKRNFARNALFFDDLTKIRD